MEGDRGSLETLLVGIDAATFSVLDSLFESGDVPTIESLFESGVAGELESQIPPWTASAWPSLYTGVNPGKHGVFSFLNFEGYDWEVVNATHVAASPIWELLDQQGKTSVVVNVPVTHPSDPFDGALVPGYTAPEDPICHPEGLLSDIRAEIGAYEVYPPVGVAEGDKPEWYRRLVRMRGEAFCYLADRFAPEFGFVQFQQTDTVFHDFPGDSRKVRDVYRAVDDEIERLIDGCDPSMVIVASDHGIGPYADEFQINEFLRSEGFCQVTRGGSGMPSWAAVHDQRLSDGDDSAALDVNGVLTRGIREAAKRGITVQSVASVLERLGLLELAKRHVPWEVIFAGSEQIDFPSSKAYVRTRIECGVRINLEGREPNGIVPRSEYESVRAELISLLEDATLGNEEPVFQDVAPREEYFHGPKTENAVDIVTVPRDFDVYLETWLLGGSISSQSARWNHKREGVIAAVGDGVDTNVEPREAHLLDVAPTVLASLGLPWDERMDGDPLSFVESNGTMRYSGAEPSQETVGHDSAVESRLRQLGYIDVDESE